MWRSEPSNRFKSSYKRLSKEIVDRVDHALRTLLSVERPELYGIPKGRGYYAWEIGRSCRLLYRPDYDRRIVYLPRVCSHKEAYGP